MFPSKNCHLDRKLHFQTAHENLKKTLDQVSTGQNRSVEDQVHGFLLRIIHSTYTNMDSEASIYFRPSGSHRRMRNRIYSRLEY